MLELQPPTVPSEEHRAGALETAGPESFVQPKEKTGHWLTQLLLTKPKSAAALLYKTVSEKSLCSKREPYTRKSIKITWSI